MTAAKRAALPLFFGFIFSVFLYLQYPHIMGPMPQGGDVWEWYHDSFYRAGLFRPFDFRLQTQSLGNNTFYMPLATLTYNFLFHNFGQWAAPFFLFGMFLHGLNSILLYLFAKDLTASRVTALLGATLFLFYPANLQTTTALEHCIIHPGANLFCLSSLIFFLKFLAHGKRKDYFLSLVSFLGGYLVKITALGLIPILIGLELFGSGKRFRFSQKLNHFFPFFWIGLVFVSIAIYMYPLSAVARLWGGTTLSAFSILRLSDFLTWLVFPFYQGMGKPLFLAVPVALVTTALLVWGSASVRLMTVWILASIFTFTTSNFREISQIYRYLYYATVPFSILVSYAIVSGFKKMKSLFLAHAA